MIKKTLLAASVLLLAVSSNAFANGGTMAPEPAHDCFNWHNFYLGIEGGYSMSADAYLQPSETIGERNFTIPENTTWDNRNIGSSGVYGAFLGYSINQNVALQLNYNYSGNYDWKVFVNAASQFPSDPYEVYNADNIKIQTLLLNLKLSPTVNWDGFVPYVMGGIGAAWNKLGTIQDANIPRGTPIPSPTFNLLLPGKRTTNFSWDAGVGVDYYIHNVSLNLGYRFVDAGKIESSDVFSDPITGETDLHISPFESNHIFLHQVLGGLIYHFS